MHTSPSILRLVAFSSLALAFAAPSPAAVRDRKSILTVNESVEAPGALLDPGVYVVKAIEDKNTRSVLRILDEHESKVILTVIALPNYRLKMPADGEFSWYERPKGWPPALRAWFYPGDSFGLELVYPKRQAAPLAQMAQVTVPSVDDAEEFAMTASAKPDDPVPSELSQTPIRPTEATQLAQAREPEPVPAPTRQAPERTPEAEATPEMPPAAGSGALFVLIGILSLATAAKLGTAFRRS